MPTVNLELLSIYTPPAALDVSEDVWANIVANLQTQVPDTYSDAQAQWYVQAEMFGLEVARWRREISSGSGAEGSFSMSDLKERMASAENNRAEQRALLTASLTPSGTGKRRGSGSIPATFEV